MDELKEKTGAETSELISGDTEALPPRGVTAEPLPYGGIHIEEAPFEAGSREVLFSILSYIAAYCYILFLWDSLDAGMSRAVWTARFALLAVAAFIIAAGFMLGRRSTPAASAGEFVDLA